MENIRDWTISRQLWWGHRIPVWYHTGEDGKIDERRGYVVSVDQPAPGMVQDEDVLDTWFSSWLWPFATLGWPEETEDLAYFYPTQVLVSGYDILFFWIARMIMAGCRFMGEPPYSDIFITGMIKDKQGRWMSKSLGNGIDPLDMIDQYGADAVRFSLVILCAQGQDIRLDPTKFEMGRNFANKIWNAFKVFGRFMEAGKTYRRARSFEELELVERWMLHRLHAAIEEVNGVLARYRLNEALGRIYDLFWKDYCDWYLELIKPAPGEEPDEETLALAIELYDAMIRLLHPFMPFITEELWTQLQPREEGACCMTAPWPEQDISPDGPRRCCYVRSDTGHCIRHSQHPKRVWGGARCGDRGAGACFSRCGSNWRGSGGARGLFPEAGAGAHPDCGQRSGAPDRRSLPCCRSVRGVRSAGRDH